MNVYFFGTGGSGVEFMKMKFCFTNQHCNPHQRGCFFNGGRVVYTYANPYDILLSFARRFSLLTACSHLQGDMNNFTLIKPGDAQSVTLEEYMKNGVDCFRFGNHWNEFLSRDGEIMLVKYEALADEGVIRRISEFIRCEAQNLERIRPRISDYKNESARMLEMLYNVHGGWFDHYRSLPEVIESHRRGEIVPWTKAQDKP